MANLLKSWNLHNLTAIYWKFKKQITFLGPYEILFLPNSVFFVLIFLNSILMVKLNFNNQKHV